MKLVLLGYGKMGQRIEELAKARGDHIVAIVDPKKGNFPFNASLLEEADLYIDFSRPEAVIDNARQVASIKKPLLIGTTGFEKQLPVLKALVNEAQIGCLFSPNFSIGVALFKQIVQTAAKLFQHFPEYDCKGIEMHHNQKLDAPSGTALMLQEAASLKHPFTSVRCGHIPGIHTLIFDGESDTIKLTHEARNRDSFVKGALFAADWLIDKKGFFTFDEALCHYLKA